MNINWRVRFQHGPFLMALFSLLLLLAQQVANLFGYDITPNFSEQVTSVFNTILSILVLIGVVSDPTTSGTGDSEQALRYDEPKERSPFE
ncbi:phage holin [Bacillus badius]|uniref:Phage holin n=1 Tax=Bacillus badius TaxID=1455 RepID=A0ABR5ANQ4_BACBA|nr:phage holin [Bacillus badius]KIL72507.1 Phage holin [Bacillus badius]MED4718286.1 phage holin [Bacillus badius]